MTNRLKLYLGLARASNLPTVWTNALAAWALAGRNFEWLPVLILAIAGSLLYSGGCTLNDAFDAEWDRQRRSERPIPSGALSAKEVWLAGSLELASGLGLLAWFNWHTVASGAVVVLAILLYDWLHKKSAWTVLLMGWCRAQWVVTAAFAAGKMGSWGTYHAIALFLFIMQISLTARSESVEDAELSSRWERIAFKHFGFGKWLSTQLDLIIPVVLFLVLLYLAATSSYAPHLGVEFVNYFLKSQAFMMVCLLLAWISWAKSRMSGGPSIGIFVGRALAGITLLDAAFACLAWQWSGLWLMLFLPLCLLLQRRIAAT